MPDTNSTRVEGSGTATNVATEPFRLMLSVSSAAFTYRTFTTSYEDSSTIVSQ
jgi:hypothetical protein